MSIWVRIWRILFGKKFSMENPLKVQARVDELNATEIRAGVPEPNEWVAINGYFALTGFDFNHGKGQPNFNPGYGVPVKVFRNIRTGEIKTYSAYFFEG